MQLLTSSPCTKRRHISRARGGSNVHPSPAQPLVAARSPGGFTGRAKARPARCAEAEPGEVLPRWQPEAELFPGKVLCKAAWVRQFQCCEFALVSLRPAKHSGCFSHGFVSPWHWIQTGEMARAHLQWCHWLRVPGPPRIATCLLPKSQQGCTSWYRYFSVPGKCTKL